jgi:hypothetical protein
MRRSLGQYLRAGRSRFRILSALLLIFGTGVKGATTLNSVVDVWLGTTMPPSIDMFGTAVAAGAV